MLPDPTLHLEVKMSDQDWEEGWAHCYKQMNELHTRWAEATGKLAEIYYLSSDSRLLPKIREIAAAYVAQPVGEDEKA